METSQTSSADTASALEQRMQALRIRLDGVHHALINGSQRPDVSGPDVLGPDMRENIDWFLLEWRWIESQIARQGVQIDSRAGAVIAQATKRSGSAKATFLKLPWSRLTREPEGPTDGQATAILAEAITQSDGLLALLSDYREFLQAQLVQQEAELARQFDQLNSISIGSGAAADAVTGRIEMLQDFVDGSIGMISSVNLLYNKIMVDVEASILALTSLGMEMPPNSPLRSSLLQTLFQRAQRGLLTASGITHRKAVIDDAFQRKLSTTRQATG